MMILPGQLAYFFVLAIVPTLTLVTIGAALLNLSTDVIYNFLATAFSPSLAELILSTGFDASETSLSMIVIIIAAYYIASNGISSIIVASNTIYGIKNSGYFKRKLKSAIMILILIFLFIFMLLIPMFGDNIIGLIEYVNMNQNVTEQIVEIIRLLQGPILWCILFLFIKLIYTMAPDKKIDSSSVNFGALFTTICWILVTFIYSIYINNYANYDALYGNLTSLIVLMLWFYILAFIFTIGLALNYHKEENETEKIVNEKK